MRSSDPNALRQRIRKRAGSSGSSSSSFLSGALLSTSRIPYRVAGSLVPSRALGDEYLKQARYSCRPFKPYLPYITHKPQVRSYRVERSAGCGNGGDSSGSVPALCIVMATDGLWDLLSNDTAGMLALGWAMMEGHGLPSSDVSSASPPAGGVLGSGTGVSEANRRSPLLPRASKRRRVSARSFAGQSSSQSVALPKFKDAAELLVYSAVRSSASSSMLGVRHLLQLPRGRPRRQILDDITVGVLVCGDTRSESCAGSLMPVTDAKSVGAAADSISSTPGVVFDLIDPRKEYAEADFS